MLRAGFLQGILLPRIFVMLLMSLSLARAEQTPDPTGQPRTFDEIQALASAGDENAQNLLGAMYQTGSGTDRNETEAVRWYSKAAAQGHAAAQANLAAVLMEGRDVTLDPEQGVELLKLSAAQHHPLGIARLGAAYLYGNGVARDVAMGTDLLLQAVDMGVGLAAYHLGSAQLFGYGGPKDEHKAKDWFRKSAELGYPSGQYVYARDYETDTRRQLEFYHLAANAGHTNAQYVLGMYYQGAADLDKAVHWYRLAALGGNEKGNQALFKLGLPDVEGNRPINDAIPSTATSTNDSYNDLIVTLFAAGIAIALVSSLDGGGDNEASGDTSDDAPLLCNYGESDVGGYCAPPTCGYGEFAWAGTCMAYPDEWVYGD